MNSRMWTRVQAGSYFYPVTNVGIFRVEQREGLFYGSGKAWHAERQNEAGEWIPATNIHCLTQFSTLAEAKAHVIEEVSRADRQAYAADLEAIRAKN